MQEIVRDNTSGTLTGTRYYTHNGSLVAMRVGGANPRYVQSDQHGTAQVTVSTTDFTTTRRTFDPYGNPLGAGQGLWPDNRGFLNMPHNPVTGLTDIGARKYDPTTGTFVSVDPILDTDNPQQWNPYAYSNNNPVTYSDPSGLYCDSCNYYAVLDPENQPSTAGFTLGCSYSTNGHCGPIGSGSTYEDHKLHSQWQSGTGDGSNQPTIYGHRLPTAEEMQRGFSLTAPIMMAPGETYEEAVTNWATYLCNSGIAANSPGFCEWSYTVGNERADGWDVLWLAVDLTDVVFPKSAPLKGAKAANEAVDLGRILDDAFCSFTGDTNVLMADGTQKPIKDVEVGDEVLASDPETGARSSRKVTALTVHQDTVLDLVVEDGSRVTTTEDHPFWNATDGEWERADQLDPGDVLLTADGSLIRVVGLDPTAQRTATAHNLTVATIHTYYVLASDTPVLVHNCGSGIALGKQKVNGDGMALDVFAMERGALSYKEWAGSGPWYDQLKGFIADGKTKIHVNLDGIDDPVAYARSGANVDVTDVGGRGFTRWEMYQLSISPDAWSRVTWYRKGGKAGNPFE